MPGLMLKKNIDAIKSVRYKHPRFFYFASCVILLFLLQLVIKTEITPLGYFSLYSDPAYPQASYKQVLPAENNMPLDIYSVKGTGFLMLEILPARYDILRQSDHCNQMNHKLQRIGLSDKNTTDCARLGQFHNWFASYMGRLGLQTDTSYQLLDFGFKDGKLLNSKPLDGKH
jgi:hypothetical protein